MPTPLVFSYYPNLVYEKGIYCDLILVIVKAQKVVATFFSLLATDFDGVPYSSGCAFGSEGEVCRIRAE